MNTITKITIVAVLVAAVIAVIVLKKKDLPSAHSETTQPASKGETAAALPRLMEFGQGKCLACKAMKPIIEALKTEYAGRLDVESVDIGNDPTAVEVFNIRIIPTQIFFDALGNELYRHEQFMSKEDIIAKWKELGIPLD